MPGLSVIIPTRDRPSLLIRVLNELQSQTAALSDVEIIVVDDGSQHDARTVTADWIESLRGRIRLETQPPLGPAAARNRGLASARMPILLFMGDDILPSPGLIESHQQHHRDNPSPEVALLGRVTWNPQLKVTPLMHWLENGGPQFCYGRIDDPLNVPPEFFWTANLSVKAEFVRSAGGFSKEFPDAAFEDVELGARLAKRGMILHYDPRVLGYHHHPITFQSSLRRMKRLARGALIARETIPDLVYVRSDSTVRRLCRRVILNPVGLSLLTVLHPIFRPIPRIRNSYYRLTHDLHYRAALRQLTKS